MVGPVEGKRSDDADEFCAQENADACQGCECFLKITMASSSLIRRIFGCWYSVTVDFLCQRFVFVALPGRFLPGVAYNVWWC